MTMLYIARHNLPRLFYVQVFREMTHDFFAASKAYPLCQNLGLKSKSIEYSLPPSSSSSSSQYPTLTINSPVSFRMTAIRLSIRFLARKPIKAFGQFQSIDIDFWLDECSDSRNGYRSGHYDRNFTTTSGDVTLHVPKLKGVQFETAIIERYRRRETSIE